MSGTLKAATADLDRRLRADKRDRAIYHARYELGAFTFDAYGATEMANGSLIQAVKKHCTATGADARHMLWAADSPAQRVQLGRAYGVEPL